MTRYPGVHIRSDSNAYQFGLRAPRDLSKHFPKRWAIRCSLGTSDLRQANDNAKVLHAEWVQRFAAMRLNKPMSIDLNLVRIAALAKVEKALPGIDSRSATYATEERQWRIESGESEIVEIKRCAADGKVYTNIEGWLSSLLKPLGYRAEPLAVAEAIPYVVLLHELNVESLTDSTRTFPYRVAQLAARHALVRLAKTSITPESPTGLEVIATEPQRIGHALTEWKDKPRDSKTAATFTRHAMQFAEAMGNPMLKDIDRDKAKTFQRFLEQWALREGKTARTADNIMVSIRTLVNVAKDRGWVQVNPFDRLTIDVGGKRSMGREPWTQVELARLFDDSIWTTGRLPDSAKAGREAAYWVPLIACYTGARVSEIAQLYVDDLTVEAGTEAIEIRADSARGQRLKTGSSWRAVPMHSELIRLGLPTYVRSLPADGPLFPALPKRGANGAGGQIGQWFGDFKRAKGFASSAKTMHSFRHTVETELGLADASQIKIDAILGHQGRGEGAKTYGATIRRQAQRLRPVIELLRFDALLRLAPLAR